MKVAEIKRDRELPGWRAVIETISMDRRVKVRVFRIDLGGIWQVESIDNIPAYSGADRVRPETHAHKVLEAARIDAESALSNLED